jgi:hypothetical protein
MSLNLLWPFFHCGKKQNISHFRAYCKGYVTHHNNITLHSASSFEMETNYIHLQSFLVAKRVPIMIVPCKGWHWIGTDGSSGRGRGGWMTWWWGEIDLDDELVELHVTHLVCAVSACRLGILKVTILPIFFWIKALKAPLIVALNLS